MSQAGSHSLDSLAFFISTLEAQGVRVAVIDNSCFSGNTIALSTEKTCVLSAADALTESVLGGFVTNFKKGVSLEDSFLLARTDVRETFSGFPEISSPIGKKITKLLGRFREFATYVSPDDLDLWTFSPVGDCNDACLMAAASSITQEIETVLGADSAALVALKQTIVSEMKDMATEQVRFGLSRNITANHVVAKVGSRGQEITWMDLCDKAKDPTSHPGVQLTAEEIIDFKNKNPIFARYTDELLQWSTLSDDVKAQESQNADRDRMLAIFTRMGPFSTAERPVYLELYRKLNASGDGQLNPCADFKF